MRDRVGRDTDPIIEAEAPVGSARGRPDLAGTHLVLASGGDPLPPVRILAKIRRPETTRGA